MSTRSDLVHEALKNLGFLPEGTAAPAEEYAMVDNRIDGVMAELEARNVLYVPDTGTLGDPNSGQFEDKHFGPLGHILANAVKARFGQHADQTLEALAMKAEADLYTIEAQPYTRKIVEGQYY